MATETNVPRPDAGMREAHPTFMPTRKIPLFFTLLLLGLSGIIALVVQPLPMLDGIELPYSEPVVRLLMLVQPTVLLIVAVLIGVNVAPQVGLNTPVIQAILNQRQAGPMLRQQIIPAVAIGLLGALVLTAFGRFQLATVPEIAESAGDTPLLVLLLYGGITEELLLRWGLMSLFVWIGWRFAQGRNGLPSGRVVWYANIGAALLFGVGHLPAAFMIGLTGPLWVSLIIGANAVLGILYGWLFWRKGLEAAIMAHGLTHLFAILIFGPLLSLLG